MRKCREIPFEFYVNPDLALNNEPLRNNYNQKRSQPDDLVTLCKCLQFTDSENNQFGKKWIMIIYTLKFA